MGSAGWELLAGNGEGVRGVWGGPYPVISSIAETLCFRAFYLRLQRWHLPCLARSLAHPGVLCSL
jgi:hypothetical protein